MGHTIRFTKVDHKVLTKAAMLSRSTVAGFARQAAMDKALQTIAERSSPKKRSGGETVKGDTQDAATA